MRLWVIWSSKRFLCPRWRGWKYMTFKVSSKLNRSMILWVYEDVNLKYFWKIRRPFFQFLYRCSSIRLYSLPARMKSWLILWANYPLVCFKPGHSGPFTMMTRGLQPLSIYYPSAYWVQCGSFNFLTKDVSEMLAYIINLMHYSYAVNICQLYKLTFQVCVLNVQYNNKYTNKKNSKQKKLIKVRAIQVTGSKLERP